jgi:DNA-binding GntR family transcriptional regulator
VRNRPQRSFEEHQTIVDALREGDAEKAVQSIRSHVVVQGERFGDLVASLTQMTASVPLDAPEEPAASA